jgi:predicted dehydrogenase
MASISRRRFLEDTMFAATAALAASPATRLLAKEEISPTSLNEHLSVAVVGVNGRGTAHLDGFGHRNGAQVTHICDADEAVGRERAAQYGKRHDREPKYVRDMRELFDDKSIDIISIATPNHWHALASIWAIQAGKDVYVEKPVSHNVSEGRRIVEAARKYGKICQTGTQCRSMPGAQAAIEYVTSGKIGDVKVSRGLCYKPRGSIGPKGTYAVPASVNYDLWCGPAAMKPLTRRKFHYDWHWQWECGNGDLGNQGIHQVDVARWGLGVNELSRGVLSYGGRLGYEDAGETANTQVIMFDYGDKSLIFEVRGLSTDDYRGARVGNVFHGSDGYVVIAGYENAAAFDTKGKMVQEFKSGKKTSYLHFDNFLDAVRSRKAESLHADILEGHLSSALCHLGNISYRLGSQVALGEAKSRLQGEDATETFSRFARHLADNKLSDSTQIGFGAKLAFDPKTEKFVGDSAADAMLTRDYRAPFVVPAAGQV